jgi:hypothetical protein
MSETGASPSKDEPITDPKTSESSRQEKPITQPSQENPPGTQLANTPETPPENQLAITPDKQPETPPGPQPETIPGTIPGVTPDTPPRTIPDTTPGTIPGVTPDTPPRTIPGTTPGTTPRTIPDTPPGPQPGTIPGTIQGVTPDTPPRTIPETQQRRRGTHPPEGTTPCYRRVRQLPNPDKLVPLLGKNSYRMYYCTGKDISSCSPESTIARPLRERCVFIDERGTQSEILPRKIWYDPTAPIEVTDNTVIEGVTWKWSSMFKGFKGFKGLMGKRRPRRDKTITITTADQPTLVTESKAGIESSKRIRPQKYVVGESEIDMLDTDPFESESSYSQGACVIS